jgi:hypothetical protein
VSWWTWPSRRSSLSSRLGRGADGEENVRRDRRDRDTGALACGQVAERDVAEPGRGPQDDPQVHRPGGGGGHRARRAGEGRGRVAGAGPGVVPGAVRHAAAAGDVAGDRSAPRLHRRAGEGRGADVDDPPAAAGRVRAGGERRELPPLRRRQPPGGGQAGAGDGLEPAAGRGRGTGADRLRDAGPLARSRVREAADCLGVRDGAGLLTAHVRPPGAEDGPAGLDRVPRGGVRVLRRRPGAPGPGQPEDRGRQA